jgi:hypothetical protein
VLEAWLAPSARSRSRRFSTMRGGQGWDFHSIGWFCPRFLASLLMTTTHSLHIDMTNPWHHCEREIAMKAIPRLRMATPTSAGTTKGFKPAPLALLPPIPLYRRLLRAHRKHLSKEMRQLGDQYIKSEFRAHRNVENPVHIVIPMSLIWCHLALLTVLRSDFWRNGRCMLKNWRVIHGLENVWMLGR